MRWNRPFLLRCELGAIVLYSFVPFSAGCVNLGTPNCESSPRGCENLRPDARRADSKIFNKDTGKSGNGDLAPPHSGGMDSGVDPGTNDNGGHDGGRSDGAPGLPDPRLDAGPSGISVSEGGIAPDASSPISIDTMRMDTMSVDVMGVDTKGTNTRTDTLRADRVILPDVVPIDSRPAPDAGTAVKHDAARSNTVTFSAGKAVGAMSGNGWVAMGVKDTVTSPTCGASAQRITPTAACAVNSINWDTTDALCLSGTLPALSSSPTTQEYGENWGVKIGVDASEPIGPLGRDFRTVSLKFTGAPTASFRAAVHINGTSPDLIYCVSLSSSAAIPLTSFNTSCWDDTGVFLKTDDIPEIDHIDLQVIPTSQETLVNRLCLTSIVLGS